MLLESERWDRYRHVENTDNPHRAGGRNRINRPGGVGLQYCPLRYIAALVDKAGDKEKRLE